MADQQRRVDFQAGGNLLEYMRYIREEAKKIARESLQSAQQQSQAVRDQIALIKQRFEQEQRERNKVRDQILAQDKLELEKLKKQLDGGNLSVGQRMSVQRDYDARLASYNQTRSGLETEDRELFSLLHEILASLREGTDRTIQSDHELMGEIIDEQHREREDQRRQENQPQNPNDLSPSKKSGGFKDLFNAVLGVENLKSLTSSARQALRTENGYDAVVSTAETGGKIAGGGVGAIIGGILGSIIPGAGTILGAGIGANLGAWLGGELAGGITEQMKRAFDVQIQVQSKLFEYAALTGIGTNGMSGGNINTLNSLGLNFQDYAAGQAEIAKRKGFAVGGINASEVTALQRALGVQTETTYELIDTQRMGIDQNKDTFNTITGLMKAGEKYGLFPGGDRTFLSQFLGQFNTMSKQLGQVQTKIDDSLVAGLLLGFNKLGGQWQLRDPRSMANISTLNESLANPQDDIAKVINFRILRRAMPGASLDRLNEEESKGVFSKYLLKGILQEYSNAPAGTVLTALRNRLGGDMSFDAIRELYKNRDKIMYGNADINDILKRGGIGKDEVMKQASDFTTIVEKNTALINNAFAQGAKEGVKESIAAISAAIEDVFNRSAIKITVDSKGNVTIDAINNTPKVNTTNTPKITVQDAAKQGIPMNPNGTMRIDASIKL